jgi:predicted AAA+ superfamily ATPase
LESTIWVGEYPEPALYPEKRDLWLRSYIQTYIERDVRQLQNVKDLRTFESFVSLCAASHGQTFSGATLSRKCGMSLPTIRAWSSVLEASYLCWFLPPYFNNYGKRVVKTPKFYFIDSAIVCALTRQPSGEAALAGPMGGALFEGLIVGEAYKVFAAAGKQPDLFFWRSNDGLEVDLIVQIHDKLYPVEIKQSATPTPKHVAPLVKLATLAGRDTVEVGTLVCCVDREMPLPHHNQALPWWEFPQWLKGKVLE